MVVVVCFVVVVVCLVVVVVVCFVVVVVCSVVELCGVDDCGLTVITGADELVRFVEEAGLSVFAEEDVAGAGEGDFVVTDDGNV